MTITTASKPLINLIKDYQNINSLSDLKRRKLTGAQHYELQSGIRDLAECGATTTICEELKRHYSKFKLSVTPEGIGWRISL